MAKPAPETTQIRIDCTDLAGDPAQLIAFRDTAEGQWSSGRTVLVTPAGATAALTRTQVAQLIGALDHQAS